MLPCRHQSRPETERRKKREWCVTPVYSFSVTFRQSLLPDEVNGWWSTPKTLLSGCCRRQASVCRCLSGRGCHSASDFRTPGWLNYLESTSVCLKSCEMKCVFHFVRHLCARLTNQHKGRVRPENGMQNSCLCEKDCARGLVTGLSRHQIFTAPLSWPGYFTLTSLLRYI